MQKKNTPGAIGPIRALVMMALLIVAAGTASLLLVAMAIGGQIHGYLFVIGVAVPLLARFALGVFGRTAADQRGGGLGKIAWALLRLRKQEAMALSRVTWHAQKWYWAATGVLLIISSSVAYWAL